MITVLSLAERVLRVGGILLVLLAVWAMAPACAGEIVHVGEEYTLSEVDLRPRKGCVRFRALQSGTVITGWWMVPGMATQEMGTIELRRNQRVSSDFALPSFISVREGSIEILGIRKSGGGCVDAFGLRGDTR